MEFNEQEFLKALAANHLTGIFKALQPIVDGVALHLFGNTEAEDFKQEAVIRVLESGALLKFDPSKGRAYSYFTTIIKRAMIRAWEKSQKDRVVAFGLAATVTTRQSLAEALAHLKASHAVVEMAKEIGRHMDRSGGLTARVIGEALAAAGYNNSQRKAFWRALRRHKEQLREVFK